MNKAELIDLIHLLEGKVDKATIHKAISFVDFDIIDRNEYIAIRGVSRDDIREELAEKGYSPTEENVDKVIDSGVLDVLNGFVEEDFSIIEYAIDKAMKDEE